MFIPYAVDVPPNHRPVMNWLLVASIFSLFFVTIGDWETKGKFLLYGWNIKGLFGYMWFHAGFLHVFGNLIFLWLFGNAICSKIGNVLYIPVYIFLGLIAAASHVIFSEGRAIGASGAINGIVGMYLVFFPENSMSCFFLLFFRPIFFSISGFWMILFWFAFDIFGALRGSEGVAYIAHIGGFLSGFGLAVLMLKLKWVKMERDEKSILQMFNRKKKKIYVGEKRNTAIKQKELNESRQKEIKSVILPELHDKLQEKFIRFECLCGQKIKVPRIYAGKNGRCPKCKVQLNIPDI